MTAAELYGLEIPRVPTSVPLLAAEDLRALRPRCISPVAGLVARLDARVMGMWAHGLLEEVEELRTRGLERGVTARRKRNQGRLEKLWEMRAQRAAMLSPAGTAKLKIVADEAKTKRPAPPSAAARSTLIMPRMFTSASARGSRSALRTSLRAAW